VDSTATSRIDLPASSAAPSKGSVIPPKFDPAHMDATTQSGNSPSGASCETASWPMTVWWSNTEFSPLRTANRDLLSSAMSSVASALATAWVPVASGSSLSTLHPTSVSSLGLMHNRTEEPHHVAADGF
jgi:hypothetical protein